MHSPKNDDDDDLLVIDDDSTNSNFNLAGREDFTIGNSGGDIEAEIEGYNSPKQDNNDIAGTSSNTIINFISTSSEAEMITNFNLPGEQNDDQSIVANIVEDLVQNISGSPEAFKPNRIDSDNESNEGNSTLPKIIINKKILLSYPSPKEKDLEVLKKCYFKTCYIPLEKIENAFEKDKKEQLRIRLKAKRDAAFSQKEKSRKRDRSSSEERPSHKKSRSKRSSSPYKSRTDIFKPAEKKTYTLCCVCKKVVTSDSGKESLYCSRECIQKKVDLTKKSAKNSEQIVILDSKGAIATMIKRPTMENLLQFLTDHPKYQPIVNTVPSGQTPSRKTLTDEELKRLESQRNDVRQVITRKLEERSKIENMNFAYKRYKDLGVEIEKELFQRHGDMDTKYRKWLKLFISAVLENKNNIYIRDILRDKVSARKLVTLSVETMNTPRPKEPEPKEAKTTTKNNQSGTQQGATPPIRTESAVVTTLDDELPVNIDSDPLNLRKEIDKVLEDPSSEYSSSKQQGFQASLVRQAPYSRKPANSQQAKSAIDSILGDGLDTTSQHNSHLYDSNCQICKRKSIMEAKEKEKMDAKMAFEEEREKRVGTQKKTSSFPTIKSGRGDDFDFRDIPSKRGDDYDVDDDYGGMDYDGGAGFDDNENDDFDGGRTPGPEAEYVSAENRPQLDEEEEERSDDVWARSSHKAWDGVFRWGGSICFSSKLTAILNHRSFAIAKELSPLTNVVGWMSIEDVWNVVRSLKDNNLGARLAVLLMEPPTDIHQLTLYSKCCSTLQAQKDQCCVLSIQSDSGIRDGFLFSVDPMLPLPDPLVDLKFDGPGLPAFAMIQVKLIVLLVQKVPFNAIPPEILAVLESTAEVRQPQQFSADLSIKKSTDGGGGSSSRSANSDQAAGRDENQRPSNKQSTSSSKQPAPIPSSIIPMEGSSEARDPSRTPTADVGKKSPSADISDFAFRDGTPIIDSSNMDISYGSSVGEQASSAVAGQQYAKQNSSQPPAANFLPPPTTMAEVLDRIAILTNPHEIIGMVSQFKLNYVPNLDDLALIGKALDRRREQQGPNQQLAEQLEQAPNDPGTPRYNNNNDSQAMPNADQQSGGKFAVKMEIKGTLTPPPPPPLPESLGASPFPPLSSTDYGTTTNHPSQEFLTRAYMPSHQNEPISTMTNPTANYNIGDSDCRHYTNLDNQSPYSCYISDSIPQNHGASAHQYAQQDTPSTMDRREEGHSPYYLGDTTHTRGGAYDYEGLGATSNYRLMHQQSPTYDMQPSSYNRDREASAATAGQQRGDYYHQQSKWQEMYNYDDYDHQSQQQQRLFSSGSAYEPSLYQQQQQGGGYDSSDRNMPHYPQSTAAAGLQGSSSYSSGAYDYQYQRQKQLSPLPILPDYQRHHHRRPLLSHETGPPSNNYDQQMNNYRQLQQQQQRIPSSLGHGQQLVKLEDGRLGQSSNSSRGGAMDRVEWDNKHRTSSYSPYNPYKQQQQHQQFPPPRRM